MKKIVILRGVPGTGKTTWGMKYYVHRKKKNFDEEIRFLNRDTFRKNMCNNKEKEYRESFDDKERNDMIRGLFWMSVEEAMSKCDLLILDTTMIDYRDIFTLCWHLFKYEQEHGEKVKIRWKIFLTEHGSVHNVPPSKMAKFRQMFDDTTDMVNERILSCLNGVVEESDEKWNFIV